MNKLTIGQKAVILVTLASAACIPWMHHSYYGWAWYYDYMNLTSYLTLLFAASTVFLIVTWGVIRAVWRWIIRHKVIIVVTLILLLIAVTFSALYQCGVFGSWTIAVRPAQQSIATAPQADVWDQAEALYKAQQQSTPKSPAGSQYSHELVPANQPHKRDIFDEIADQSHRNADATQPPSPN
jgi:hypothetical protein